MAVVVEQKVENLHTPERSLPVRAINLYLPELKVIVLADEEGWFAQGFEIDHDAEGSSLQEVKRNFEASLAKMVHQHLETHSDILGLLKHTPVDTWSELWDSGRAFTVSHSPVSEYNGLISLPFSEITYFESLTAVYLKPSPRYIQGNEAQAGPRLA